MKDIITESVTSFKEVTIGITCDQCGKKIRDREGLMFRDPESPYFRVDVHDESYGGDYEGDSYRHYELCSLDCLTKHMTSYYTGKLTNYLDPEGKCYEVKNVD